MLTISFSTLPLGSSAQDGGRVVNNLSWHHEVLWVIYTIAADSAFVVTVAYFSFFFRLRFSVPGLFDIPRHTVYTLLMLVDTLISHVPVRLFHFIYAYIFGAAYVLFTLICILSEANGLLSKPLFYPSLDFSDEPLKTTAWLSLFLVVGIPVGQMIYFLFYKMRVMFIDSWFTSSGGTVQTKCKILHSTYDHEAAPTHTLSTSCISTQHITIYSLAFCLLTQYRNQQFLLSKCLLSRGSPI